ncbi:scyllo-inositol 2-dehydrogenase (NADP(+)) IolU [Petrocella atlantisensis]|uniref:Scyllo-inositol 2-dehydrogenase (NADP(+)) IolU n=1 Tax=Petrocella atlantisensis TaxID=2173034 RepID=A0A3P7S0X5_9FIRM|nr:Gfo/Idh/MocA family oxidoreductase [Petrocella atlantisensis]VDN48362.1 scyllo-inositol 2-dehydrogenase (NADP(+)) IolU [Petrocella atlantisensis]
MEKLRFATIGTNFIVERFLEASLNIDEIKLSAVYSRSIDNARKLLKDSEAVKIYTDLNELATAEDIDFVYIASPTSLHMEHSIKMLEAGKHVICEKPMASNSREYYYMKEAARKNNVVLFEAMRPLYHPSWKIIQEGMNRIGRIHKARLSFCKYSSRYDNFKRGIIENAFRPELSNGAVMDIGIYCIEAMLSLFGKPQKINTHGYVIKNSIDAYGVIIASYENMICCLDYSKITNSETPCEIQGEDATLYFDKIACPSKVWINKTNGEEEVLFHKEIYGDMKYEIHAFINLIRDNITEETHEDITESALLLTDQVRADLGIVFPNDVL